MKKKLLKWFCIEKCPCFFNLVRPSLQVHDYSFCKIIFIFWLFVFWHITKRFHLCYATKIKCTLSFANLQCCWRIVTTCVNCSHAFTTSFLFFLSNAVGFEVHLPIVVEVAYAKWDGLSAKKKNEKRDHESYTFGCAHVCVSPADYYNKSLSLPRLCSLALSTLSDWCVRCISICIRRAHVKPKCVSPNNNDETRFPVLNSLCLPSKRW